MKANWLEVLADQGDIGELLGPGGGGKLLLEGGKGTILPADLVVLHPSRLFACYCDRGKPFNCLCNATKFSFHKKGKVLLISAFNFHSLLLQRRRDGGT